MAAGGEVADQENRKVDDDIALIGAKASTCAADNKKKMMRPWRNYVYSAAGYAACKMIQFTGASTDAIAGITGLPFATALSMFFASSLLAVLAPLLLWRSAGRPLGVVWTASVVLCSYIACWILSLSRTTDGATSALGRMLLAAAMAVIANDRLSPAAGAVAIYLDTILAAGMLGYAVADHRQYRTRTEQSAADVLAISSTNLVGGKVVDDDRIKRREESKQCVALLASLLSLCFAVWALYRVRHYDETARDASCYLVLELSMIAAASLGIWADIVGTCMLHQALVSEEFMGALFPASAILLVFASWVAFDLLGVAAAVFVFWVAAMGAAGFLGYCLSVHARYKQLACNASN